MWTLIATLIGQFWRPIARLIGYALAFGAGHREANRARDLRDAELALEQKETADAVRQDVGRAGGPELAERLRRWSRRPGADAVRPDSRGPLP